MAKKDEKDQVIAAGEAAIREVIERSAAAGMPQDESGEFVYNSIGAEYQRGNQRDSVGWIHAPATVELLKTADDRLTKVSELRGNIVAFVKYIRAVVHKKFRVIYLLPADENDPDRIPVNRYDSSAIFNIITALGPAKLTLPTHARDRYRVDFAPEGSPFYPALMIDLKKRLERKSDEKAQKAAKARAAVRKGAKPASAPVPAPESSPAT